jgi:hypothetical protein
MLKGRSYPEFFKEVERRENTKKDYMVDTRAMRFNASDVQDAVFVDIEGAGSFNINETAHQDISEKTKIPKQYYDRMKTEAPDLWASNVNYWTHSHPERRMVRVLDGNMRALLSDSFRPIDNFDIFAVARSVLDQTSLEWKSLEVTDRRMYIQVVFPKMEAAVKVGDVVQSGLVISNSEIGQGSVRVEPLIYRLVCLNGMITSQALRKFHVGARMTGSGADVEQLFSNQTRALDDKVFFHKVADMIRGSLKEEIFQGNVAKLQEASGIKIELPVQKTVEVTKRRLSLTDGEGEKLLENLIEGQDLSLYGLGNAVTCLAHVTKDFDRSVDMERWGGEVLGWGPALAA